MKRLNRSTDPDAAVHTNDMFTRTHNRVEFIEDFAGNDDEIISSIQVIISLK